MSTANDQDFRRAMAHFATGVAVVTTRDGDEDQGATISALTSVSLDPLLLLICLNRDSATCRAISNAGWFGLSVLNNSHKDVAMAFASRSGDKFASPDLERADNGTVFVRDALVQMRCELVETFSGGTHALFMARPTQIVVQEDHPPLLYFQGKLGVEI